MANFRGLFCSSIGREIKVSILLDITFNGFVAFFAHRDQHLGRDQKTDRGGRQTKDPLMLFKRFCAAAIWCLSGVTIF